MSAFLITVNWIDNAVAKTAICGVEADEFPSAIGALNAAQALVQSMVAAKAVTSGGNPTNFTASVLSIIADVVQQAVLK